MYTEQETHQAYKIVRVSVTTTTYNIIRCVVVIKATGSSVPSSGKIISYFYSTI